MGKSPAKWFRSVLFGKKSSRSQTSKRRDGSNAANDKEFIAGKGPSHLAVDSLVISQPVLVNSNQNGIISESENTAPSNLFTGTIATATSQQVEIQENIRPDVSRTLEKVREEQAATKVQAVFKGYLSRRAFRVLKGIIRLQALVRGHLVRRQAVVTLHCLYGIVKLQAVVRGRKVRLSVVGPEVKTNHYQMKDKDHKLLDNWTGKLSISSFICKLLSVLPVTKPLQIHYIQGEPNSVLSWLERWSTSHFSKPLPQPKKAFNLKSRARKGGSTTESGPGTLKRNVHRNMAADNFESGPANVMTEPGRLKHNLKKLSSSPTVCGHENPQYEIERVKRSLKKVSNPSIEPSSKIDIENQKPTCNMKKVTTSINSAEQGIEYSFEKMKEDFSITPDSKCDTENAKPVAPDSPINALLDGSPEKQLRLSEIVQREENDYATNEELISKEKHICDENPKSSKRRASFSSRSDHFTGNGNAPKLPSYMTTTVSSKAKLRGQVSPRFGSDSLEKSSITRRHSLPSSINGKLNSQSPRTQKLIQASCKGGLRMDRSLSSSRDEKAIQVAWRR